MLTFKATPAQWAELEALAYWIADNSYCRERMSRADYEREEQPRHHETIISIFNALDRLSVPYWTQNAVITWAEDWRQHAGEYMEQALTRRGYNITREATA